MAGAGTGAGGGSSPLKEVHNAKARSKSASAGPAAPGSGVGAEGTGSGSGSRLSPSTANANANEAGSSPAAVQGMLLDPPAAVNGSAANGHGAGVGVNGSAAAAAASPGTTAVNGANGSAQTNGAVGAPSAPAATATTPVKRKRAPRGTAAAAKAAALAEKREAEKAARIAAHLCSTQRSRLALPGWIAHHVSATGGASAITIPADIVAQGGGEGGQPAAETEGRKKRGTIFSIAAHPDGERIATAGLDTKIRIWNTEPIWDETWEARMEAEAARVAAEKRQKSEQAREKEEKDGAPGTLALENGAAMINGSGPVAGAALPLPSQALVSADAGAAQAPADRGPTQEPDLDPMVERKKHTLLATLSRHTGACRRLNAFSQNSQRLTFSPVRTHTGSVLVVRWSHSGRYLASGSDDTIALVWEWDRSAPNASLAAGGANAMHSPDGPTIENWRPVRRLAGHTSDVVDLAWAPHDMYLATISLDSVAIIYNGRTFERLRRIDGHDGFIKGVCFDPIGEYMATASDDRTLKVWKTADWSLATSVTKPFEKSRSQTFFRRPSWSPDGAHLLSAGAMDGDVFISKVVERNSWKSDVSLVGHENAITVTSFSPVLFTPPKGSSNLLSLMALGSMDAAVSIWLTGLQEPILVAREVFTRQVMDLSWSADGLTLYACSADGDVACFRFAASEIAKPASREDLLKSRATWQWRPTAEQAALIAAGADAGSGTAGTSARPNVLQVRKKGDGRLEQKITVDDQGRRRIEPTNIAAATPPAADAEVVIVSADASAAVPAKRRASQPTDDLEPLLRANKRAKESGRALGSEFSRRLAATSKRISTAEEQDDAEMDGPVTAAAASSSRVSSKWLPLPSAQSTYKRKQNGLTMGCTNSEDAGRPCEIVQLSEEGSANWVDWAPGLALHATCTSSHSAVAMADGSVLVFHRSGRRLATLRMPAPCIQVELAGSILMLVTTDGDVRRWNVRTEKEEHQPVSLVGVVKNAGDMEELFLHASGVPIVVSKSREEVLALDAAHSTWRCVASGFFHDCSELWDGRLRVSQATGGEKQANKDGLAATREPVKLAEALINQLALARPVEDGETQRHIAPSESLDTFRKTMVLRHLEMRMQAAVLLESAAEYKADLLMYAKKIAEAGDRELAEDLFRTLMGPIYL